MHGKKICVRAAGDLEKIAKNRFYGKIRLHLRKLRQYQNSPITITYIDLIVIGIRTQASRGKFMVLNKTLITCIM